MSGEVMEREMLKLREAVAEMRSALFLLAPMHNKNMREPCWCGPGYDAAMLGHSVACAAVTEAIALADALKTP